MDYISLIVVMAASLGILKESSAVNVANGKRVIDCRNGTVPGVIVDGDSSFTGFAIIQPCAANASFRVILGGSYYIHYVVLYEGNNPTQHLNQLEYFVVELISNGISRPCGQFPQQSHGPSHPYRVNCQSSFLSTSEVRFANRKNLSIYISEVEVHTLTSGRDGEKILEYRGCFITFKASPVTMAEPIIQNCHVRCLSNNNLFLAIKDMACYCGDNIVIKEEIPGVYCDDRCSDNMACGSASFFSVYITSLSLPTYYGCYIWGVVPHTALGGRNMTLATCINHCADFRFALIKDGCFCMNDLGSINEMFDGCTRRCGGHYRSFCGGNHHASIYRTCKLFSADSINCNNLFNCAVDIDQYGSCPGECKQNFRGEYCFERSGPTTQKEKCIQTEHCKYLPNTECVIEDGEPVCKCKEGFIKSRKGFCIASDKPENKKGQEGPASSFIIIPLFCLVIVGGICCFGSSQLHDEKEKAGSSVGSPQEEGKERTSHAIHPRHSVKSVKSTRKLHHTDRHGRRTTRKTTEVKKHVKPKPIPEMHEKQNPVE